MCGVRDRAQTCPYELSLIVWWQIETPEQEELNRRTTSRVRALRRHTGASPTQQDARDFDPEPPPCRPHSASACHRDRDPPHSEVPVGCPGPPLIAPGAGFPALSHRPAGATVGVSAGHSRFFQLDLALCYKFTGDRRLLRWRQAGADFWGVPDPWPDWRVSKGHKSPCQVTSQLPTPAFCSPARQAEGAGKVRGVPWGARPWDPPAAARGGGVAPSQPGRGRGAVQGDPGHPVPVSGLARPARVVQRRPDSEPCLRPRG